MSFYFRAIPHTSVMSMTMANNFVIAKYVCEKLFWMSYHINLRNFLHLSGDGKIKYNWPPLRAYVETRLPLWLKFHVLRYFFNSVLILGHSETSPYPSRIKSKAGVPCKNVWCDYYHMTTSLKLVNNYNNGHTEG